MKKLKLIVIFLVTMIFLLPQTSLAETNTDSSPSPTNSTTTNTNPDTNSTTNNDSTSPTDQTSDQSTDQTNATDPYNGKKYVILTPNSTKANFNGTNVTSPAPYIKNGTTMLPLRFICQNILGASVDWNTTAKTVQVTKNATSVFIDLKKGTVKVNGAVYNMAVSPALKNNTTYIPLRLLAEKFNCQVNYDEITKLITIILPEETPQVPPVASVQFTTITAGQSLSYVDSSSDPSGLSITAHEWQVVNNGVTMSGSSIENLTQKLGQGTYTVRLRVKNSYNVWSSWYETTLTILANEKPVVSNLKVNTTTAPKIGQDIDFTYDVANETWETITATKWQYSWLDDNTTITKSGKPKAFFKDGMSYVTLQVKDAYGNWSDPVTVGVNVSKEVVKSEAQYKFENLINGEVYFNMQKFNFNSLDPVNITSYTTNPQIQLFCDNPEKVNSYGILYKDTAQGNVRLHYYHENAMSQTMKIYTLVHNTSSLPVTITINKAASAGPTTTALQLGFALGTNYFNATGATTVTIPAGGKYLLNPGIRAMKNGEVEAAIIDVTASAPVTFVTVAMSDSMNYKDYAYLYPLSSDQIHSRGTFAESGIDMSINLDGSKAEKIILGRADAHEDYFSQGTDALSGQAVENTGNYGVMHTITITADKRTGILANPRGSIFQGVLTWNGGIRPISASGYMKNSREAAVMGVIEAGQTVTIQYMTPDGSDSPMLLVAIPENLWSQY